MIYKPKPAGHPMFRLSPQFLTQFKIRWRCSRRVTGFQHGVTYLLWLIYDDSEGIKGPQALTYSQYFPL